MARRPVTRRAGPLAAALALSACLHAAPPAPLPGEAPETTVLEALVRRFRAHPPHRGLPLAVAPVTVSWDPARYPLPLSDAFGEAALDLDGKQGRLERIGPPFLAGVEVRREGVYDPYDLSTYLLLRFSPVGFSADTSRAVVVVAFDCGPGCGSQAAAGLRRAGNGGWRIAELRRGAAPAPPDSAAGADGASAPPR